jgi:hypothetical protein
MNRWDFQKRDENFKREATGKKRKNRAGDNEVITHRK